MMLAEICQADIGTGGRKRPRDSPIPRSSSNTHTTSQNSTLLLGRSRAGDATAFAIPSLKWMLDCGAMIQRWTPRIIFLTHTHSDHIHFLSNYLVKDVGGTTSPPTVYLPAEGLPLVKAHLEAYRAMVECGTTEIERVNLDDYLRPLQPNQDFFINQAGQKFRIQTIAMNHRIPCLGFGMFRITSKLKAQYVGMPGREIGQLKKSGVEIADEVEEPFMCFMGDTTAQVFRHYPEVLSQHNTVVVECTFLDAESRQRSIDTMHTHWDDLQNIVADNPNTMFLLTHFSLKYTALLIRQFFRKIQEIHDNIHPMLIEREVEQQWASAEEAASSTTKTNEAPRCQCRLCRVD